MLVLLACFHVYLSIAFCAMLCITLVSADAIFVSSLFYSASSMSVLIFSIPPSIIIFKVFSSHSLSCRYTSETISWLIMVLLTARPLNIRWFIPISIFIFFWYAFFHCSLLEIDFVCLCIKYDKIQKITRGCYKDKKSAKTNQHQRKIKNKNKSNNKRLDKMHFCIKYRS